jgi:hypothetical protein
VNDDQVDRILAELSETRDSFDQAIRSVKWNRVNTITQYCLIVLVFILGGLAFLNYVNDNRINCERGNEFRISIAQSQQDNALSIGVALSAVLGGSQEDVERYMEAYMDTRPETLPLREC